MAKEDAKIRFSLTQVVGGAVAALSAAVAASFLGVYGTIVGAAVMGIVSTSGTMLYEQVVSHSKNRLDARRQGTDRHGKRLPWRELWARVRPQLRRPRWWKTVGAVSLLIFAVAIGAVTAIEASIGKPMAAAVTGQHSSGGTSLRLAATGGGAGPTPARQQHKQDSGDAGQDGTGGGEQRDRSTPDQDTPQPTPGAGSAERAPHATTAPSPTQTPEEGDQPENPADQPTPTR